MNTQLLTTEDNAVLKLVYTGHDVLSNLTDFLGKTTPNTIEIVLKLEVFGYLKRIGTSGAEYLRFILTEKGVSNLELSEKDRMLFDKYGITEEDLVVLKTAKEFSHSNHSNTLCEKTSYTGMQIVVAVENLEKKGYLEQRGIIRRYLNITESGEKVIKAVG